MASWDGKPSCFALECNKLAQFCPRNGGTVELEKNILGQPEFPLTGQESCWQISEIIPDLNQFNWNRLPG